MALGGVKSFDFHEILSPSFVLVLLLYLPFVAAVAQVKRLMAAVVTIFTSCPVKRNLGVARSMAGFLKAKV